MSMYPDESRRVELEYGRDDVSDKAVFNFFNAVYAWMAVGLAITATVAYLVSQNVSVMKVLYGRGVFLVFFLGTAALAYAIRSAARNISAGVGTALFLLYSAIIGALISFIFIIYPMNTIAAAFIMTGGVFGGMSVYGFVTKRDLTTMGSYLIMAVWGLLLATIVNVFWANNAMSWVITYVVLIVFIGLTAYDTQMLRNLAIETAGNPNLAARYAIIGSLELYVDFINIFMSILRILGSRK